MTARTDGRDDGDLSPEVLESVTNKGRMHLGILLVLMGLLCVGLPRVIEMPAQDTESAVAPDGRRNIAEIAIFNSTVMGLLGIAMGGLILAVRPRPSRYTM